MKKLGLFFVCGLISVFLLAGVAAASRRRLEPGMRASARAAKTASIIAAVANKGLEGMNTFTTARTAACGTRPPPWYVNCRLNVESWLFERGMR